MEQICRSPGAGGQACILNQTRETGGAVIHVNMETSVVGAAYVGIAGDATRSLMTADPLRGNSLSAKATWGLGSQSSLSGYAGKTIQLEIALTDAKLYSVTLECDES